MRPIKRFFENFDAAEQRRHRLNGFATPTDWNLFERQGPGGVFQRNYSQPLVSGVTLPRAWQQYNSQDPNGFVLSHVQQTYDRTFVSASTRTLNFFDQPRTTDDQWTNVYPYANSVLIKAIGLYFKINPSLTTGGVAPGNQWVSRLDDLMQIVNTGQLTIQLSKRQWGPFALWKLASGGGLWGLLAGGGTPGVVNYANVGMPTIEAAFRLTIPFVIPANSQAKIQMIWPSTITMNNGDPVLTLCFEGVEAGPKT